MQTAEHQLTVIERSATELKNGGVILLKNQERSKKAIIVGENILKAIAGNSGKLTPELDERCQKFLVNCNVAVKEMKEGREGITQLMDELKKLYTEAENNIDIKKADTMPAKIQVHRNEYARQIAEEEKRKRQEAERKEKLEKQRVEYKASITGKIATCLIDHIAAKKQQFTVSFNSITLDDYTERSEKLKNLSVEFNRSKLGEVLNYVIPDYFADLDGVDLNTLRIKAHDEYNFDGFCNEYRDQITGIKNHLIDRLPSKKAELEQIAKEAREAEERRIKQQREDAEKERLRQEAIEKAKGEARKRLEEKSRLEAAADEQRRQREAEQAQADRLRKEQEIKDREAAEERRLQLEREENQRKADADIEMKKQGDHTMLLFQKEADIAETTVPKPEVREGYEIEVTHAAGFVQIFQFWFEREGKSLSIDKIGKTSLNQMKAFAEKQAQKNNEKIDSKMLKYNEIFKAVNRKAS